MSQELRDVLTGAEAATARALPDFDHAVMAHTATRRSRRRRVVRTAGTVAAVSLAAAAVGIGGVAAADMLTRDPAVAPTLPSPTVTNAPEPSPTASPTPGPDTSAPLPGHTVTVADGLPAAKALTQAALDGVGADWVLAVFDSTFRRTDGTNDDGERVLYLVSPAGERYEVANLTAYDSLVLKAWDSERAMALLTEDGNTAVVVDMVAGSVAHEWEFCGENVWVTAERSGRGWGLHGSCEGEPLDARYADDGSIITRDGFFQSTWGMTVTLVGGSQVVYEFERAPEDKFKAVAADGTVTPMQVPPAAPDCYPVAAGEGALVAQCTGAGPTELWALPINGGAPTLVGDAGLAQLVGGPDAMYQGYCLAGGRNTYVIADGPATDVVVLRGGPQTVAPAGEFRALACYPSGGAAVVVSGKGPLWAWEPESGAVTVLLPVPEPGDDGTWVGASENGVLVHP